MKREEALTHFVENYVSKISLDKLQKLENYYENNEDILADKFIESFRRICIKIKDLQKSGIKGKIAYINYSLLRTNIIEGTYSYLVQGLNRFSIFDRVECQEEYDVRWTFQFLDELEKELLEKSKLYINKVFKPDVERFIRKEFLSCNNYIVKLAEYAMPRAVELEEFREILKEDVLKVRVGEYKGYYKDVYIYKPS